MTARNTAQWPGLDRLTVRARLVPDRRQPVGAPSLVLRKR